MDNITLQEARSNESQQSNAVNCSVDNSTTIGEDEEWDTKKSMQFMVKQVKAMVVVLIIDIALPLTLYFVLQKYTSQLISLIVSGIPPLLYVIYQAIRDRRLDALGCIIVFCMVLSGVISIISGMFDILDMNVLTEIQAMLAF